MASVLSQLTSSQNHRVAYLGQCVLSATRGDAVNSNHNRAGPVFSDSSLWSQRILKVFPHLKNKAFLASIHRGREKCFLFRSRDNLYFLPQDLPFAKMTDTGYSFSGVLVTDNTN